MRTILLPTALMFCTPPRKCGAPDYVGHGALKRLSRYLRARPRMVFSYERQSADGIEVYTDTDWAGCPRTRKSTSGGCLMVGRHLIKAWSATQASLALSSGEAEFYGVVRGVGVGMGLQALYRDVGLALPLRVWTDSTAAIGTAGRQGLGKLRHLECHSLWVQQRLRRKEFKLLKVAGESNPADLFTKHLESRAKLDQLVALFNCRFVDGRAESAPALRRDPATVNIAHDSSVLPHLHLPEDIAELFEEAVPEPARHGETDLTPAEELQDPVPTIIARREARQKLNARVPLQGTTIITETTKNVSRAPRISEPQPPHKSSRPLAVAGALSARRTRSLLQSDSPCNIVGVDICTEASDEEACEISDVSVCPRTGRPPASFTQPPCAIFYNNSFADYVDRRNTRRVLHSEGQGTPVNIEPRKKSLRPFTSVGALGASFVFVTTALHQKIRSVVEPRLDAIIIVPKFCQPRLEPSRSHRCFGDGSGGVLARGYFGSQLVDKFVFSEE